jgi:Fic family protein
MPPVRYHDGAFPPETLDWPRLIPLIGPASSALARYDGLLTAVPNAHVLLAPLSAQEAVLSSRIEGTQTTLGEVLEYEAGGGRDAIAPEKAADYQEVLNYRAAVGEAQTLLGQVPLSSRVLRKAQATLLSGVRGQGRAPGEFRKDQNYIGSPGRPRFMPIEPLYLHKGMSRWEKYLHSEQPDLLVQLAIIHAEFEALHPFSDGNGRVGRMLIPLFLFERRLLSTPTFYMSAYLEDHRDEYYERLFAVSRDGDWTGWCVFFLQATIEQAQANAAQARDILELYASKKDWVVDATHSQHAIRALDFIFNRPIFPSSDFVGHAGIPRPTATRLLRALRDGGLLRVLRPGAGRRPAVLAFPELLNIAEGRRVF